MIEEQSHHPGTMNSYRQTGTLYEGGRIVDFIYTYKYPDKFRAEVQIDGDLLYAEGYNGIKAWEMDQYLIGEPAIALENSIEWPNPLRSLQDFEEEGKKIQLIDTVEENAETYYQLRLTLQNGTTRDYFLNTETYTTRYIEEKRKLEPGGKPQGIETVLDDYRIIKDTPFPFHEIERIKGEEEALIDIQWIHTTPNPVLNDGVFDKIKY